MDGFESTPNENTSLTFDAELEAGGDDRFGYKLVTWTGYWTKDKQKKETFAQFNAATKVSDLGGGIKDVVAEFGNVPSVDGCTPSECGCLAPVDGRAESGYG